MGNCRMQMTSFRPFMSSRRAMSLSRIHNSPPLHHQTSRPAAETGGRSRRHSRAPCPVRRSPTLSFVWSSQGHRPVYFHSTVGGSFASKLATRNFLTWIMCGRVTDPPLQIPRKSEHGEHHLLNVRMGMTVISMTKILTRMAPRHLDRSKLMVLDLHYIMTD